MCGLEGDVPVTLSVATRTTRLPGRQALVLVVAALLASAFPATASGAAGCAGTPNVALFAGWWSSPTLTGHEPEGVKGTLFYQPSDGCASPLGFDKARSAWVMIASNDSLKYAQSGYWNDGGAFSCWRHFSEYETGSGFIRHNGPCSGTGAAHVPLVKYITATGATELWIDSTRLDVMTACSCNWRHPLEVQIFGESHDSGTDVPGYVTTKTDWNKLQIQYYTDNTWHGTCGTITLHKFVDSLTRYAADSVACDHTRSWTDSR
jgi:hypothetical protein